MHGGGPMMYRNPGKISNKLWPWPSPSKPIEKPKTDHELWLERIGVDVRR